MANIQTIADAFIDYCYDNVDDLEWKYFRTETDDVRYYRTRIEKMEVVIGYYFDTKTYFLTIKSMGQIAQERHRFLLPTKLQRLFTVISNL